MSYLDFIKNVCKEMEKFANKEELNLSLLRSDLQIILDDVKREIKKTNRNEE